jgi:predicted MFS family arabinose efflux permease
VGALAAAFSVTRISARFGVGRTAIAASFIEGPAMLLIVLAPKDSPIPYLLAAQVIISFAVVAYNVMVVSFRQALCPERMQGRMNSVMRFIVWGTIPLGNLTGGAIATAFGLREAIVVGAIGGGLAFLWLLLSPMRHVRNMPTEPMTLAAPEPAPA